MTLEEIIRKMRFDIAKRFEVPVSTVDRWVKGTTRAPAGAEKDINCLAGLIDGSIAPPHGIECGCMSCGGD